MKAHDAKAAIEHVARSVRSGRQDNHADWLRVTVRPSEMTTSDRSNAPTETPTSAGGGRVDRTALAVLLQTPARAAEIPLEQIPALVAELASEQAALFAIQGVLTARLLVMPSERASDDGGDRLLTAEEVARMLGVTKRWVQRRARRLPFSRRISVRSVRYSEAGLKRWMANRHVPKP